MSEETLLSLAESAFNAIAINTNERLWSAGDGLKAALTAFDEAVANRGVPWLIDSTIESGMTHLAWATWMREARKTVADS